MRLALAHLFATLAVPGVLRAHYAGGRRSKRRRTRYRFPSAQVGTSGCRSTLPPPVAHLHKAKDALNKPATVLDLGPHGKCGPVLGSPGLVDPGLPI